VRTPLATAQRRAATPPAPTPPMPIPKTPPTPAPRLAQDRAAEKPRRPHRHPPPRTRQTTHRPRLNAPL